MSYTPLLRRIRADKTNYRKRKALLIGRHNFAAVRVSNQNVLVQILKPSKSGDEVLVSAHSRELLKHGWKGARKSIPACYLTGLLAGRKALAKNVNKCILYTGNRTYSFKVAACVKGLLEGGMNIPVEEETLPGEDMLYGKHVANYANELKQNDNQLYTSRFSALIKDGFMPENYPEYVEKAKLSITGKSVVKGKSEPEVAKKVPPKESKKSDVKSKDVSEIGEKKQRRKSSKSSTKPKKAKGGKS